MSSPAGGSPIGESERSQALDALRGFALLGILISHVPDFSGYSFLAPTGQNQLDRFGVDSALAPIIDFLIRGKFFSLFSLLFGIGFAVQIESARRRGASFTRHFSRRLAALFVIGLAHASIWYGDILKDYALIGFLLMFTANWSGSGLILAIAITGLVRVLWPVAILLTVPSPEAGVANPGDQFSTWAAAFAGDSLGAIFSANFELLRLKALQIVYDGKAISVLFMFLIGALIGRLGLHRNFRERRGLLRTAFWICAPVGIAGNAMLTPLSAATPDYPPTVQWVVEQALFGVAVPAMTLAYASGFALLWLRGGERFLMILAPAGRMALTTYVSQSLILIALFYGVGLGFYGAIGLADGLLVAAAIFSVQCIGSALWLRYFGFGPLEWLWRCATYGAAAPLIRPRESRNPASVS